MLPTVVIVGRPNVGKSTLFNRLTRSQAAIVADTPGVTRDRHFGRGRFGERPYLVVDTGGFEPQAAEGLQQSMASQTLQAISEGDAVVFLTDARQGLTPQDQRIATYLRTTGRRILLCVNKSEGLDRALAAAEFHELGLGAPWPISAAHGDGVPALVDGLLDALPRDSEELEPTPDRPRIAVVGRPNAGKSTLVNALIGEQRMITSPVAGTTRDSINTDFERRGRHYTLIDTAGLRRRARVTDAVEKFSVIRAMQAIESANVAILVLDALEGPSDQDAHIAGFVLDAGRAAVVAINKWDAIPAGERTQRKAAFERQLKFLDFASFHYISALNLQGLDGCLRAVDEAYRSAFAKMPTPQLTRIVRAAMEANPPPRKGLTRPKLRFAHQGGSNPPIIVIHGTGIEYLRESYRRFLEHRVRAQFKLNGTPLRIEFRQGRNPYVAESKKRRR